MRKTYRVRLFKGDIEVLYFECPENLSIFRGARLAGIEMSAGCMQGRCQICRATLHSGELKSLRPLSKYATNDPAALPNNAVLPCSVVPTSNVSIAPRGPWRLIPELPEVQRQDGQLGATKGSFTMLNPEAMPDWD